MGRIVTSLPQLLKAPPTNDCGGCTACCDVIGVPSLGKPYYARCYHAAPAGCGIYATRPDDCRKFRCAWHMGVLGERPDRRPDQCGLLFAIEAKGSCYVEVYELTPGAATSEKGRYLLDLLMNNSRMRKLPMASPAVRIFPYGADVRPEFPTSNRYDYVPPTDPIRVQLSPGSTSQGTFIGRLRGLLMPRLP
jgi:hypothetical protein